MCTDSVVLPNDNANDAGSIFLLCDKREFDKLIVGGIVGRKCGE